VNARRLGELARILTRCPGQLDRAEIVVGEHLRPILRAVHAQRRDPLRSGQVLGGSPSARDLSVRDVSNQHVQEDVLILSGDGGAPLTADELLAPEGAQALLNRTSLGAAEGRNSAGPEDLPEDGRVLDEGLLLS
jgi:hypothetical protein